MPDYFTHDEVGAPQVSNAPGSFNALLYTLLVTGFRVRTPTSVTVAGGVATVVDAGHGYSGGRRVRLVNATTAEVNGDKLITVTGAGSYTFAAPGVPDGQISGPIETRRAPLGWARPLDDGAGKSIFTRADPAATSLALRVDHSATTNFPGVRMVETFGVDVDTFTAPTPAVGVVSLFGLGPNTSSSRSWLLVGDGRTLYWFGERTDGASLRPPAAFGDINSYAAGDPWACMLANETTPSYAGLCFATYIGSPLAGDSLALARLSNGLGGTARASVIGFSDTSARVIGGFGPVYPSAVDNGMVLSTPVFLSEANTPMGNPIRGELRGLAAPLANVPLGTLHRSVVSGLAGSARRWLFVGFSGQGSGMFAVDIDGPW